ncbi:MAG TPA: acyltransferase [Humisphaera sp.]|jgi:peptidoglycan/LPS O-acetylase OafA/YrhL|nr:acyltransferase [Humisphaera sp.]
MLDAGKPIPLERYRTLDAWRGLASLGVVMLHAMQTTVPLRFPDLLRNGFYAVSAWGRLGVPIFFVVSGYCICGSACAMLGRPDGARAFVRARFLRIYPPYLATCLAAAALAVAAKMMVSHGALSTSHLSDGVALFRNPAFVFSTLTITQRSFSQPYLIAVFWTLCYEVMFYAVVLLVMLVTRLVGGRVRGMLLILHSISGASLLAYIFGRHFPFPFDLWPQFGLGVLAYDLVAGRRWRRLSSAVLIPLTIIAFLQLPRPASPATGPENLGIQLAVCLTCAIALKVLHPLDGAMYRSPLFRPIMWIGLFSYSLYLIHPLVMGAFLQLTRSHPPTAQTFIWHYWAQVLLSIAVGYVFYCLVERAQVGRARQSRGALVPPSAPTPANVVVPAFVPADVSPVSS